MSVPLLSIAAADNDRLFDEQGRSYLDLFSAHGTTWLGHANRPLAVELSAQLEKIWITGGLPTAVREEAKQAVEAWFPPSHYLAAFYSTGMEAAEFALRVARAVTGKNGVVGFERSMHGKSLATSYLGWNNNDGLDLPDFVRLPFVPACSEERILDQLADVLSTRAISAVMIEPLQASGGGHMATERFYQELARLCASHQVLLVFDELLTGFHRTGPAFFFSELQFVPDIVLIGKSLGNGFPVSGVIVDRHYPISPAMFPGSTFSDNPLAAAAVRATLRQMCSLNLFERVQSIEKIVVETLGPTRERGIALRGRGALWILELPEGVNVEQTVVAIYERGVAVGFTERIIRLLPAATIDSNGLARACSIIAEELRRATHVQPRP
ncbi:MAG TPA: aminotransferase class III-fold pyridoxal phosphate-dependent enzyme [Planctomycetaceae bacterium]|nr:aminotransferase class III-fold pyridoxal phosphate-dependent enzyme [Planctomycetaceae bacterium]